MQYRPDRLRLLLAVGDFLEQDVRPALDDPAMGFRVLIAANLCRIVAGELMTEPAHDASELKGLAALLPDLDVPDAPDPEQRRAAIARGNAMLAERLREGQVESRDLPAVREHLWRTLCDRLSVSNPRFDTSREIE